MNSNFRIYKIKKNLFWKLKSKINKLYIEKHWINTYTPNAPIQSKLDFDRFVSDFYDTICLTENDPTKMSVALLQVYDIDPSNYYVTVIGNGTLFYNVENDYSNLIEDIITDKHNDNKLISKIVNSNKYFISPIITYDDVKILFNERVKVLYELYKPGKIILIDSVKTQ